MGKKKKKAKEPTKKKAAPNPSSFSVKRGSEQNASRVVGASEQVAAQESVEQVSPASKEAKGESGVSARSKAAHASEAAQGAVSGRVAGESFSWFPGFPKREAGPKRATFAFWAMTFVMIWVVMNAWICDDAFITFRSIDHWFHGHGLRWNAIERVQSYTHPLWMFLIAGVHLVVGDLYWSAMLLSLVITALTLWLLFRYAARSTMHILLAMLVLSFSRSFIDFATSGLENPLAHLLLVIFLLLFFYWVREEPAQKQEALSTTATPEPLVLSPARVGVLVGIACLGMLNRMDHALLYGFPVLYALWHTPWTWRLVRSLGFATFPLILWESFSLVYYGLLVPNTAYAKLSTGLPWDEMFLQGLYYFFYTLQKDTLTFVFLFGMLGVALFRSWRKERIAAICVGLSALSYVLYIVRIGGDFMAGRFLSALVVVMVVVMMRERFHLLAHVVPLGAVLILLQVYAHNPTTRNNKGWDGHQNNAGVSDERGFYFHGTGLVYARPGKIMPAHHWRGLGLKAKAQKKRVTIEGSVGMFGLYAGAGVHIVDPLALSDPLLARLPMQREPGVAWRPGHYIRKFPLEYPKASIGEATLQDPDLRAYYEKIKLVTRAPLFSTKRWEAIWGLHTGRYRAFLKRYRERAYFLYGEKEMGRMRRAGETVQGAAFLRLTSDGAGVKLHSHNPGVYDGTYSIGVSRGQSYRVIFWKKGQKVGEDRFHALGRFAEGVYLHQGHLSSKVLASGFDAVKLFPEKVSQRAYLSHLVVWKKPHHVPIHHFKQRRWAGTPWNARGNVILGSDAGFRTLEVSFPRRTHAPKLHLSADGNDDLELSFFLGRKEVGRGVLQANPSSRGGLQVYDFVVPVSARKAGYHRVVVRPLAGDGVFSIGHLFALGR